MPVGADLTAEGRPPGVATDPAVHQLARNAADRRAHVRMGVAGCVYAARWGPPSRVQRDRAIGMGSVPCEDGVVECTGTVVEQVLSATSLSLRELRFDCGHEALDGCRAARKSHPPGPRSTSVGSVVAQTTGPGIARRTSRWGRGTEVGSDSTLGPGDRFRAAWWRWAGHPGPIGHREPRRWCVVVAARKMGCADDTGLWGRAVKPCRQW